MTPDQHARVKDIIDDMRLAGRRIPGSAADADALTALLAECDGNEMAAMEANTLRIAADARADRAEAEVARLRQDAERYRWLRHAEIDYDANAGRLLIGDLIVGGIRLDAAIDAALAEPPEPKT